MSAKLWVAAVQVVWTASKNFITWAFTRNLYYMTFNIFSNKSIFLMKLDCILVCFYKLQIIEN